MLEKKTERREKHVFKFIRCMQLMNDYSQYNVGKQYINKQKEKLALDNNYFANGGWLKCHPAQQFANTGDHSFKYVIKSQIYHEYMYMHERY